jgi:hypothetical protein
VRVDALVELLNGSGDVVAQLNVFKVPFGSRLEGGFAIWANRKIFSAGVPKVRISLATRKLELHKNDRGKKLLDIVDLRDLRDFNALHFDDTRLDAILVGFHEGAA